MACFAYFVTNFDIISVFLSWIFLILSIVTLQSINIDGPHKTLFNMISILSILLVISNTEFFLINSLSLFFLFVILYQFYFESIINKALNRFKYLYVYHIVIITLMFIPSFFLTKYLSKFIFIKKELFCISIFLLPTLSVIFKMTRKYSKKE